MINKFTMELVWHSCDSYPPKEDYNACLYVTDGYVVFPMRWKRDTDWQRFDNGAWYIEPGINAKEYWWADITQTVQGVLEFRK